METRNATIKSTALGYEDHGILTVWLNLDYGDSGQGFGGYALDMYDRDKDTRVSHRSCGEWITAILKVVGVRRWEDLPGKHIRVQNDHGKVHAIGNLLKDEWFIPATHATGDASA